MCVLKRFLVNGKTSKSRHTKLKNPSIVFVLCIPPFETKFAPALRFNSGHDAWCKIDMIKRVKVPGVKKRLIVILIFYSRTLHAKKYSGLKIPRAYHYTC